MTRPLRHLLISYHTCPTEQPGQDLAGGMNVLLQGFLQRTTLQTDVVTRSFGTYQRYQLKPGVVVHRLPCGAARPWTRQGAWAAWDAFAESFQDFYRSRDYDVATAHYWMSARLLPYVSVPSAIMFHTLQVQKGPPQDALERRRQDEEKQLIAQYPCAFLHWHDLNNARRHYPQLRGSVVRPGCALPVGRSLPPQSPPWLYGWAARADAIKNFDLALQQLESLRHEGQDVRLAVAGMEGSESPGVTYLGALPPEDMIGFYDGIHQLWNLSSYETFGLGVLEALTRGRGVGLLPSSDWAKRLRRVGVSSQPGRLWNEAEHAKASALAECYSWERALPRWERWLTGLASSFRRPDDELLAIYRQS